jgi:two-component system chemotaxis response regulator CheY
MSRKDQLRIMVVDDTAVSRGLITQVLDWLRIENYRTCNDGQEALRDVASSPVHLVISDYYMPGLDGLGLLQGLRTTRGIERTGFILVTGRADETMVARGRSLGMNNMILKPFTKEQMKACIEQVVGPL